jgi:hypothetical protein
MKIKRIFLSILLFFIIIASVKAQVKPFSIGGAIGIGEIKGNSPSVTSFGGSVFFDFQLWFTEDVSFRTGFLYARKIEYFLPESRLSRYYPFLKAIFLKGILNFKFSNLIFTESNAGVMIINDRTFSDINIWEPGVTFGFVSGFDFTNNNFRGIKLGLGIDSGIAFTKTSASYYQFNLQLQYFF